MRKIILTTLILIVHSALTLAQQNNPKDLPLVVPPTPEVSAIIKAGLLSNDLHTGAASATIKLYELENGPIKFPISLAYRSNGIKVNDIPSRVGIGWSLMANGMVSRTVRDEEDDRTGRQWQTTPDFNPYDFNEPLYNYLFQAENMYYDSELDEYSFSVNGYSGRFFIGADGLPKQIHHTNLSIVKENDVSFIIRTPDGIKYFFGGSNEIVEKTKELQVNGSNSIPRPIKTAWFLYKIQSPEGHEINFYYSDIITKSMLGLYQSVILQAIPEATNSLCEGCDNQCAASFPTVKQNSAEYYTKILSYITTSNGVKVDLVYEDRSDPSGDKRLKELIVSYNGYNGYEQRKKFEFQYDQYITTGVNRRFFLKKLREVAPGLPALEHEFVYDAPSELPDQYSLAQDFFGYANGANTNSNFFPIPLNPSQYANASQGANRNPDFTYGKKGSLTKIIYPTGGYQEFIYEAHTLPEMVTQTTYSSLASLYGEGISNTTPVEDIEYVTTNAEGKFKIDFSTFINPYGPQPGQTGYFPADGLHPLAKVEIRETGTTSPVLMPVSLKNYNETTNYIVTDLLPNTSYQVKLIVYKWSVSASVVVSVPVVSTFLQNTPGCGIRVKQINSLTETGAIPISKYYTYAALSDLNKSSGVGLRITDYNNNYNGGLVCNWGIHGCVPEIITEQIECQGFIQLSSSSQMGIPDFSGSPVAYSHVIESDDVNKNNGGMETKFNTFYNNQIYSQIRGYKMAGIPQVEIPALPDGTILSNRHFKKTGQSYSVIKETIYDYSVDGRWEHSFDNYIIRKRWQPVPYGHSNWSLDEVLMPYDIVKYTYWSFWYHLDKQTDKVWFENSNDPLIEETTYEYGSLDHLQPTRITTINSKGETKEQLLTYPTDYASTAPYSTMISKGIISPVIETSVNKIVSNTVDPLQKVKTSYASFGSIEKPNAVLTSTRSNSLVQKISFNVYSGSGRILEQQKTSDVKEVYLWGYKSNYPVAKLINTTSEIAEGYINQNILDNPADDQTLRNHLNNLRNISGAMVYTYTYKPLVGITSETDPSGKTTYYEYDDFNRLSLVRDKDNNILKKFCYNYTGQPEECGILYFNTVQSGIFTRNNCGSGYVGTAVTYTVPANTYSSTTSQAAANTIAQNDVTANGQSYANTNGTCSPSVTIYARIEYSNFWDDLITSYATQTIHFYSDASCTTPYSVTNLSVNFNRRKTYCNDTVTDFHETVTCTGTTYSLGANQILQKMGSGSNCYSIDVFVEAGTGYIALETY
ncbi:MAG TPA: DUF5977 domain-containing protein [Chitinophagaceae bacterium]